MELKHIDPLKKIKNYLHSKVKPSAKSGRIYDTGAVVGLEAWKVMLCVQKTARLPESLIIVLGGVCQAY